MNYYDAREVRNKDGSGTGIWHYTCMNDGQVWPTGYCGQSCPGHATPEEAREHQRQYFLDQAIFDRFTWNTDHAMYRCDHPECDELTEKFVRIRGGHGDYTLCTKHHDRAGLEAVLSTPGYTISSY